jgi:hypothetical protein
MTTTGVSTFNMPLEDLLEEAYQRCGSEIRSGFDFKSARRSLNLLTIEWANRGINLWTIEQGSIPLTTGTITYVLPIDTIDLLDFVIRTGTGQGQFDLSITRISSTSYSSIPTKNTQGRPVQVWINRQSGATTPTGVAAPTINIWPTANQDSLYQFVYWRLRRINDAGDGGTVQDIPFRFLNAMIAGLAFYISPKIPGMDMNRAMALKADYAEQLQLAMDEDREKANLLLTPRRMWT